MALREYFLFILLLAADIGVRILPATAQIELCQTSTVSLNNTGRIRHTESNVSPCNLTTDQLEEGTIITLTGSGDSCTNVLCPFLINEQLLIINDVEFCPAYSVSTERIIGENGSLVVELSASPGQPILSFDLIYKTRESFLL